MASRQAKGCKQWRRWKIEGCVDSRRSFCLERAGDDMIDGLLVDISNCRLKNRTEDGS
jgi:hypothetical protein